jgi:hypothetical protein
MKHTLSEEMVRVLGNFDRQFKASIENPSMRDGESVNLFGCSPDASIGGTWAPRRTAKALADRGLIDLRKHGGLVMGQINDRGRAMLAVKGAGQ